MIILDIWALQSSTYDFFSDRKDYFWLLVIRWWSWHYTQNMIFLLSHQTENDPTTAVYANVSDLKKTVPRPSNSSTSTCSTPGITLSPAPDSPAPHNSAGWQVHTDHDSGKEYYYQPATGQSSWSDPRSPPAGAGMESVTSPIPVSTPSSAHSLGSDWEQLLDETTGRHYYYNQALKQTSWTAPEPSPPPSSTDKALIHGMEANGPVR